jgi:hypothetical protein
VRETAKREERKREIAERETEVSPASHPITNLKID